MYYLTVHSYDMGDPHFLSKPTSLHKHCNAIPYHRVREEVRTLKRFRQVLLRNAGMCVIHFYFISKKSSKMFWYCDSDQFEKDDRILCRDFLGGMNTYSTQLHLHMNSHT